ncbi:MAG: NEW3 domain-containing protein, partial [Chloroflexota bacterium]
PTDVDRVAMVTFGIAPFGIGLPYSTAHIAPNPIAIFIPAHGAARGSTWWRPPDWRGKVCVEVKVEIEDNRPIYSRRNIDVGEPLRPGVPHALVFPVGSGPATQPVTVTLGLKRLLPGWEVALSRDILPNVKPAEFVTLTLTVTPPLGARLGSGQPIVDVEAYVDGRLIGGFRKLDVPPVPIHKPHEKSYAESEIEINPDPPVQGQPSTVTVTVQNTSDVTRTVTLEFGWAHFGMGIPFTSTGMVPPIVPLTLGPAEAKTASVVWTPLLSGPQCVEVRLLDASGVYEPQRSRRNVKVDQRPPCGQTKTFTFTVHNDSNETATVDLGLITFNVPPDWVVTLNPSGSVQVGPGQDLIVTVTVYIPCPTTALAADRALQIVRMQAESGSVPTIDVEAYREGELVGGIELRFESEPMEHRLALPLLRTR